MPFAAAAVGAVGARAGAAGAGVVGSGLGGVRHKTTGVGIIVGNDGDVEKALRRLKRTMIEVGIMKEQKKREVG
jgi:hypothetical protein